MPSTTRMSNWFCYDLLACSATSVRLLLAEKKTSVRLSDSSVLLCQNVFVKAHMIVLFGPYHMFCLSAFNLCSYYTIFSCLSPYEFCVMCPIRRPIWNWLEPLKHMLSSIVGIYTKYAVTWLLTIPQEINLAFHVVILLFLKNMPRTDPI